MIRYKLLKSYNTWYVFIPAKTISEEKTEDQTLVYFSHNNVTLPIHKKDIDNNPDWFELIKEEPKEVFTWDDEKAKEFYTFCYNNVFKQPTYPEEMIERFKQSKTSSTNYEGWKISDVDPKPDTSKERIEICDIHIGVRNKEDAGIDYIQTEKYKECMVAIEAVLNNDKQYYTVASMPDLKFYCQQQMDKAREQTWEAARNYKSETPWFNDRPVYPTLESYLQTIKK